MNSSEKNHKLFIKKVPYAIVLTILVLALAAMFCTAFLIGRYSSVSARNIPGILLQSVFPGIKQTWTQSEAAVIMEFRFPRIIASMLVGAALAMSGAAFQTLFSNPMASPDVLGVTNGASFGAVIGILLGMDPFGIKILAFMMGCFAIVLIYALTHTLGKEKNSIVFLLLMGMIISSVFSGLLSIVKYIADPESQLPQITYWLMGSFSNVSDSDLCYYIIFFLIGAIPLFLLRWRINLLMLEDQEAKTMGVNINALRIATIICAALLTSSSTAITGGITWVGLFIPHISRALVGNDFRRILPTSALLGAFFLLAADCLARSLTVNELPISVLTSIIGAPVFYIILVKKGKAYIV